MGSDMRRKTAREILADSFRELAQEKPIDKITVREITENCGYSQATFYRQFKDKYALIAWDYTRDMKAISEREEVDAASFRLMLSKGAAYCEEHRSYLANLFLHTGGYDSFVSNMTEIHFNNLMRILQRVAGVDALDERTVALIRVYSLGTVLFSCEWILGKHDMTREELAEVYEDSLPPLLRKYFV